MGHDHELEARSAAQILRLRRKGACASAPRPGRIQVRLILSLLCAAIVSAAAQPSPDYTRAVSLIERGQFDAAIPLLRAETKIHDDARVWKALGVAYAAKGDYESAEEPFHRACDLDTKLEDACYYYGRALYANNRFLPSLEVLRKALNAAPREWKVRLGMAQALEALVRSDEAEKELRATFAACGVCDPRPGTALGLFLIRQGRFREAEAPLQQVVAKFPNAPDAHTHLGRVRLELGEPERAAAFLEKAVALDPGSAQAHLLLAKAYSQLGRVAEARPHFEAAASLGDGPRAAR